jgi:pimeloyl-ACP methyl ester carboxylesterase
MLVVGRIDQHEMGGRPAHLGAGPNGLNKSTKTAFVLRNPASSAEPADFFTKGSSRWQRNRKPAGRSTTKASRFAGKLTTDSQGSQRMTYSENNSGRGEYPDGQIPQKWSRNARRRRLRSLIPGIQLEFWKYGAHVAEAGPRRRRREPDRDADGDWANARLRAGFEVYQAFPEDEERFKQFMQKKLPMPVLALAGEKSNGWAETEMAKELATNVRGAVAPDTGHWLPDENPTYVSQQLLTFFGGGTIGKTR